MNKYYTNKRSYDNSIFKYTDQIGGACSICGAKSVTKASCPYNPINQHRKTELLAKGKHTVPKPKKNTESIKKERYMNRLKFTIKRSDDREYNIQAVAKMLGLPNDKSYKTQCRLIINYLEQKKSSNEFIKELLANIPEKNACDLLVKTLYELLSPKTVPSKAPIKISETKYKKLINEKKTGSISRENDSILTEALNCKYCHCVKKLYLKNNFERYINNNEPKYNPYAICMSSIYKNRNIKSPNRVSFSCREKYDWYKY